VSASLPFCLFISGQESLCTGRRRQIIKDRIELKGVAYFLHVFALGDEGGRTARRKANSAIVGAAPVSGSERSCWILLVSEFGAGSGSQAQSAVELGEIAIEAPQWYVPILESNFENEEIGEAYSFVLAKLLKRSLDDVRVLDGKVLVIK
jgi:hypothetical protein